MTRLVVLLLVLFLAVWLWNQLPKKPPPGSRPTMGGSDTDATGLGS